MPGICWVKPDRVSEIGKKATRALIGRSRVDTDIASPSNSIKVCCLILGHPQVFSTLLTRSYRTRQAEPSCRDVTGGGVGKCAQGLPPARATASGAATGALARPPAPGAPVRGWASMIYRPGYLPLSEPEQALRHQKGQHEPA